LRYAALAIADQAPAWDCELRTADRLALAREALGLAVGAPAPA